MARQRITASSCVECGRDVENPLEVFCLRCISNPRVCRQNESGEPIEERNDPNDDIEFAMAGDAAARRRVPMASRRNFQD